MENEVRDTLAGLKIIQKHIDQMLREVLTRAAEVREPITNRAALTLVGYISNCWTSIGILQAWSATAIQRDVTANACAAILRVMYDALLQLLYLTHEPENANARATEYLEFGAVEHYTFMETIINGSTPFARRIANSVLRSAAEPRIRSEYQRVRHRYCGKKGRVRKHWYKDTLAGIAGMLGRVEEYSWYVAMLSSSVHAGAFAAIRGPLPAAGEEFIVLAATITSQAADILVRVTGMNITEQAKRIIALNAEGLLDFPIPDPREELHADD